MELRVRVCAQRRWHASPYQKDGLYKPGDYNPVAQTFVKVFCRERFNFERHATALSRVPTYYFQAQGSADRRRRVGTASSTIFTNQRLRLNVAIGARRFRVKLPHQPERSVYEEARDGQNGCVGEDTEQNKSG